MPPGWPGPYSPVCGATNHSLGTLEHHDHLVLENLRYWNRSVPEVLARRFEALSGPWGGARLSGIDYFTYFEAMPAAQLQFPRAVKFLLGSFPSLFGTRLGRQLQAWCVERGWVLLWSLGLNLGPEVEVDFFTIGFANGTFAANQRLADPAVLPRVGVSNVSVPPAAAALFADAWEQAAAMRHNASKNASSWGVSNTSWARLWTATRDALPRGLSVEILRAGACADVDRCVGVSLSDGPSRPCLCYDAS